MKFYAIRENHLYQKAYKSGRRKSSQSLTVYVLKDKMAALLRKRNPEKKTLNRIGLSVSKKVGGAVQRNRAKRVIREAYRQIDKMYGVKKGFLVVICPRSRCSVIKMQDVMSELTYCLRKLEMLENLPQKNNSTPETQPENSPVTLTQPAETPDS